VLASAVAGCLLSGCGGDPDTTPTEDLATYTMAGVTQKGPFINGSSVTIQELDVALIPTGRTFATETTNDLGAFSISSPLATPFAEVIIEGFYFDELNGELSAAPISLRTMADLSAGTQVNVNLLTHLEKQRLSTLVSGGADFADARARAQTEVLAAFNIDGVGLAEFGEMDVSQQGADNAVLLAVSAIVLQMARNRGGSISAESSAILSAITTDIASDGTLDSNTIQDEILSGSRMLDLVDIRVNFEARLDTLGVNSGAPAFEDFVDSDADGVLNKDDDDHPAAVTLSAVTGAAPDTDVTSNDITVTGVHTEGFTRVRVDGAAVVKNGQLLAEPETTVVNGDTLAVVVHSSAEFSTLTTATLTVGSSVYNFDVTTGSETDKGDSDADGVLNSDDDDEPDAFLLTDVTDAQRNQSYTSNQITVSGVSASGFTRVTLEQTTPSTTPPRLYKNGALVMTAGESQNIVAETTVSNGDLLYVEVDSAINFETTSSARLVVGEAAAEFSVRTGAYGAKVAEGTKMSPWDLGDTTTVISQPYEASVDTAGSYYTIEEGSAQFIIVTGMTDDVDLYVYGSSDFATIPLCVSANPGLATEHCIADCSVCGADRTRYVFVDASKTAEGAVFTIGG